MARGGSGDDPDGSDGEDPSGGDTLAPEEDGSPFDAGRDGDPDGAGDATAADPDPEAEEDGWRFGLDEVDEDGIVRSSIEPGDPDPEHVAFVVLGAIAMVLVFVRLWLLVS